MEKIKKENRINMPNGDLVIFNLKPAYCGFNISILKSYINNGKVEKNITLSMWDDYGFRAWCSDDNDNIKSIEFVFKDDEPLYKHLVTLLGEDEILLIDDDETTVNIVNENNDFDDDLIEELINQIGAVLIHIIRFSFGYNHLRTYGCIVLCLLSINRCQSCVLIFQQVRF